MRAIVSGVLSLMVLAVGAHAADRPVPPPIPPVDALSAPAVQARFAQTFTIGTLDSGFSDIDLGGLRRALGIGAVASIQGLSWLCYDVPGAGQRIWLSSTDARGAMETVTVTKIGAPSSACPALPGKASVIADGGIRIGMSRAELIKRLGTPSRQLEAWVVYSAQQSGGRQGLAVQFVNDKAAFIAVTHLER